MKKRLVIFLLMGVMLLTGCKNQAESAEKDGVQNTQDQMTSVQSSDEDMIQNAASGSGSAEEELSEEEAETEVVLSSDGEIIEIREKMFVTQILDVYYNTEDYMGKQLKWEGIYVEDTDAETGEVYSSVIRYSPGCCGDDGVAGFEILLSEEQKPAINDWVEVTGTLTRIESGGYEYLAVAVTDIEVLDERGEEFVSN